MACWTLMLSASRRVCCSQLNVVCFSCSKMVVSNCWKLPSIFSSPASFIWARKPNLSFTTITKHTIMVRSVSVRPPAIFYAPFEKVIVGGDVQPGRSILTPPRPRQTYSQRTMVHLLLVQKNGSIIVPSLPSSSGAFSPENPESPLDHLALCSNINRKLSKEFYAFTTLGYFRAQNLGVFKNILGFFELEEEEEVLRPRKKQKGRYGK